MNVAQLLANIVMSTPHHHTLLTSQHLQSACRQGPLLTTRTTSSSSTAPATTACVAVDGFANKGRHKAAPACPTSSSTACLPAAAAWASEACAGRCLLLMHPSAMWGRTAATAADQIVM
jgi:hypothetical protein